MVAFTVKFDGERPTPAIVCDECGRDLGAGSGEGHVLIGRTLRVDAFFPDAPPVAFFPLWPPPEFLSAGFCSVAIACSEPCREQIEELHVAMEGNVPGGPFDRMSLAEYVSELREVLVTD